MTNDLFSFILPDNRITIIVMQTLNANLITNFKYIMARRALSKTQKVLNLLSKGEPVSWRTLRNRFDLTSPRAMIDTLRSKGHMIFINETSKGVTYRMGKPTKAILAAGVSEVLLSDNADKTIELLVLKHFTVHLTLITLN